MLTDRVIQALITILVTLLIGLTMMSLPACSKGSRAEDSMKAAEALKPEVDKLVRIGRFNQWSLSGVYRLIDEELGFVCYVAVHGEAPALKCFANRGGTSGGFQ